MRNTYNRSFVFFLLVTFSGLQTAAQAGRVLQYDRVPGKDGLNVFETSKQDTMSLKNYTSGSGATLPCSFRQ